jgi:hypothetical protein
VSGREHCARASQATADVLAEAFVALEGCSRTAVTKLKLMAALHGGDLDSTQAP